MFLVLTVTGLLFSIMPRIAEEFRPINRGYVLIDVRRRGPYAYASEKRVYEVNVNAFSEQRFRLRFVIADAVVAKEVASLLLYQSNKNIHVFEPVCDVVFADAYPEGSNSKQHCVSSCPAVSPILGRYTSVQHLIGHNSSLSVKLLFFHDSIVMGNDGSGWRRLPFRFVSANREQRLVDVRVTSSLFVGKHHCLLGHNVETTLVLVVFTGGDSIDIDKKHNRHCFVVSLCSEPVE